MKKTKKPVEKVLAEMGARIRAEREARGWTQVDLAKKAELSQQLISKVEKFGTRERESILKLSKALDRSPAYLQYGIEEIANMSEVALDAGLKIDELETHEQEIVLQLIESFRKQRNK